MITEAEFKTVVQETLGRFMVERGTFGVLEDSPPGSGTKVFHFEFQGWNMAVDSTGIWEFGQGRGFHGEGKTLEEAIDQEQKKWSEALLELRNTTLWRGRL